MSDWWRLKRVAFIVWAWKGMPLRWKTWAFLNDDMPEGGGEQ